MNPQNNIDFNEIYSEIQWFIKKTKPEAIQGGRYDVYLVKIYKDGENRYCITMGIISDSLQIRQIEGFKYFMRLDGDLVLLNYSDEFKINFRDKHIELLTDKKIIADKIYPGVAFLGTTSGYVCCYNSESIVKIYYFDSNQIPHEKKIFKYIPQGETIKLDSGELNRVFRKKKRN